MDARCATCGRQVEGALSRHVPGCEVCMGIPDDSPDVDLLRCMARVQAKGGDLREFAADLDRRMKRLMGYA